MDASLGLPVHQIINPFFIHFSVLSISYVLGKVTGAEGMTSKVGSSPYPPGIQSVIGKRDISLKQIIKIQYKMFCNKNINKVL